MPLPTHTTTCTNRRPTRRLRLPVTTSGRPSPIRSAVFPTRCRGSGWCSGWRASRGRHRPPSGLSAPSRRQQQDRGHRLPLATDTSRCEDVKSGSASEGSVFESPSRGRLCFGFREELDDADPWEVASPLERADSPASGGQGDRGLQLEGHPHGSSISTHVRSVPPTRDKPVTGAARGRRGGHLRRLRGWPPRRHESLGPAVTPLTGGPLVDTLTSRDRQGLRGSPSP